MLNQYFKLPSTYTAEDAGGFFTIGDRKIPVYGDESMLLNFYGPSRTFKYYDFLDVLDDAEFKTKDELEFETDINTWDDPANGYLNSGIFKDKIVLIGSTLPEDRDIIPTSFSIGTTKGKNMINGVEIHATAIQNILSQNFIYREPISVEIAIILVLTVFGFYLSSFFKEIKFKYNFLLEILNIVIIGAALFGIRIISFYLFFEHNYLFSLMSANMAIVMAYIGSTAFHFITERRQKGMIKGMFTQYVNAAIVDELISDPGKMALGGQRKNLSVFFSDIAGFSTFSENKEPEDLVSFLNEYLSEMTKIVFDNKGTLDKYVGDAVMAFWGAPIPMEDHAYHACKSALEMQAQLVILQERWKKEGQPLINARMGINSGDMVVGNVGGKQRFDYTVMGDAVNLASRLEGANKAYGTLIMISESTYEVVKHQFITRELDYLTVKGKNKPVKAYELINYIDFQLPEYKVTALALYHEGLELYKNQKFAEAIEKFSAAVAADPGESPSEMYIKRCKLLQENPPGENWDGVFHMTTK
ncbi:MAG: CHASE2 domain-containing protein [Ignavibacteriales bacterium]|nr:CHASE2 domain-containing protein [Ignavibacteriales bacterium]